MRRISFSSMKKKFEMSFEGMEGLLAQRVSHAFKTKTAHWMMGSVSQPLKVLSWHLQCFLKVAFVSICKARKKKKKKEYVFLGMMS